jgi:hypothetical protein
LIAGIEEIGLIFVYLTHIAACDTKIHKKVVNNPIVINNLKRMENVFTCNQIVTNPQF